MSLVLGFPLYKHVMSAPDGSETHISVSDEPKHSCVSHQPPSLSCFHYTVAPRGHLAADPLHLSDKWKRIKIS